MGLFGLFDLVVCWMFACWFLLHFLLLCLPGGLNLVGVAICFYLIVLIAGFFCGLIVVRLLSVRCAVW